VQFRGSAVHAAGAGDGLKHLQLGGIHATPDDLSLQSIGYIITNHLIA
jgi:hypothetical protein